MQRTTKIVSAIVCVIALLGALCWQTHLGYAQAVPDGLVSYWNFEKVAGKTVPDDVGGFDGTIMQTELKTASGKFGKALEFDGDGYVDIGEEVMEFGEGYSFTTSQRPRQIA